MHINQHKLQILDQHKFHILNKNREARHKLGGESTHEQQRKSVPPSFDSGKHGALTECYKKCTMSLNIAKRNSEAEGTSKSNNDKRVWRPGEGAKQLFPKQYMICKYSGGIKVKYKNTVNLKKFSSNTIFRCVIHIHNVLFTINI